MMSSINSDVSHSTLVQPLTSSEYFRGVYFLQHHGKEAYKASWLYFLWTGREKTSFVSSSRQRIVSVALAPGHLHMSLDEIQPTLMAKEAEYR
jgi:hypothetical protein